MIPANKSCDQHEHCGKEICGTCARYKEKDNLCGWCASDGMSAKTLKQRGAGMVAVLGYDFDAFFNDLPHLPEEVLEQIRLILVEPDPDGTPDWVIVRSKAGVLGVKRELERRKKP